MEPERKIEKWLRSYAKKRRGQAKDSFDLHPATRRLLQDEIARKAPAAEENDGSLSLWELFRQQWALLLTFAACVFLIGIILLPLLNTAKEKAQPTLGMAQFKKINPDMSGAVAMNNQPSPQPETQALVARQMANAPNEPAPAPVPQPAAQAPPPPTAVSAPEPNSVSESPSAGAPAPEASSLSVAREEQLQPTRASSDLAMNSASAPPAMTPPAAFGGGTFATSATRKAVQSPVVQTGVQFQFEPASENAFQNSIAPSQGVPVLSNFQVQQNGNTLRIVDGDGSVYVGSWRLANQATQNETLEWGLQSSDKQSITKTPQTSAPPTLALTDNLQAAQNYFFRVHGINRTLKQSVVFTGSLLANFALSGNAQQSFGGAVAGTYKNEQQVNMDFTNQPAQLPWSSLRITGTAAINRTNHIEVNATSITPAKQN